MKQLLITLTLLTSISSFADTGFLVNASMKGVIKLTIAKEQSLFQVNFVLLIPHIQY